MNPNQIRKWNAFNLLYNNSINISKKCKNQIHTNALREHYSYNTLFGVEVITRFLPHNFSQSLQAATKIFYIICQ